MAEYTLTREETETVIGYNDAEQAASVYTCNKALIRRMTAIGAKVLAKDDYSVTFEVPKKWVKIRPPRVMSDEQRMAARDRMKKVRE